MNSSAPYNFTQLNPYDYTNTNCNDMMEIWSYFQYNTTGEYKYYYGYDTEDTVYQSIIRGFEAIRNGSLEAPPKDQSFWDWAVDGGALRWTLSTDGWDRCPAEMCKIIGWEGSPDLAGVGMLATYIIQAILITVYLCAILMVNLYQQPNQSWIMIRWAVIGAGLCMMWYLIGWFVKLTLDIRSRAGDNNGDNKWTFGQVLALSTWAPFLIEFGYNIWEGPKKAHEAHSNYPSKSALQGSFAMRSPGEDEERGKFALLDDEEASSAKHYLPSTPDKPSASDHTKENTQEYVNASDTIQLSFNVQPIQFLVSILWSRLLRSACSRRQKDLS
ncbi:unnamed protein product [Alternaria alternata]